MPSSRTTLSDAPLPIGLGLGTLLVRVPDPRDRRGVRHALPVLLVAGVAAVLAGPGSSRSARPSESAIRPAFTRVDADAGNAVSGKMVSATPTRSRRT